MPDENPAPPSPILTTRSALAKALRDRMSQGTSGRWIAEYGENPDTLASSLLAPHAVVDVTTLADDLCKRLCDMAGDPRLFIPGEVRAVLAATLSEREAMR